MQTVAVSLYVDSPYQEFLIAELAELDFESFEQEEDHLVAYIPASRWDDVRREYVEAWLAGRGISRPLEERVIQESNWNEQWEETIRPVAVGAFLVKPTWRDVPSEHGERILLEIDPKMSFGTGYHESTRLVLELLSGQVVDGSRVLDAGTGTGILAIAAAKLGAAHVDAFDVDPWSQENAVENVYLNQVVDRVEVFSGPIEAVPPALYDLICANINLNVIMGLLKPFRERLKADGILLVSGVLEEDRDRLVQFACDVGFGLRDEKTEGAWWSAAFGMEA